MHPFSTDRHTGQSPLRHWAALLVVAALAVSAVGLGGNALAAMPPAQATLDSPLIKRTLALPIAKDDIFLIDDTLRYLGLKEESDLFRRHIKRLHYTAKLTGAKPGANLTAREAIERERGESERSLLELHNTYYRKNIEVVLLHDGEKPYQVQGAGPQIFIPVAPGLSLWGAEHWDLPKNYSPFYFGVKLTPRQPLDNTDQPPTPKIKVILDDGRTLDLKCTFDLRDLARQKVVIDWCGGAKREKLDREIVAMAQELAAGRGHLDVTFDQTKLEEDGLWLKYEQHDGIDARAWKAIETSSCFARNDCLKQIVRLASISMPLYLTLLGFLAGALVASALRLMRYSTATVLTVVIGLCVAGTVISFVVALVVDSVLGFFVLPFAGFIGAGALAASLLVCRLIKLRPA